MGLIGRQFTWTNNQDNLVMSHIDRIFCSTEFNCKFPLATCKSLPRNPSDHTPLLWEDGGVHCCVQKKFRFEKWWLQHEGFAEVVRNYWSKPVKGDSALDIWQNKLRALRKNIKGGAALLAEFDFLDKLQESVTLTRVQSARMVDMMMDLNKIRAIEEVKAKQRSRDRSAMEGDKNTKYFHTVANQRRWKTKIHMIEGPDGPVHSTEGIQKIAMDYFKLLFRYEDRSCVELDQNFFSPADKLSSEEAEELEKLFLRAEVKKAIHNSYFDGPLGLKASPLCFTRSFGM